MGIPRKVNGILCTECGEAQEGHECLGYLTRIKGKVLQSSGLCKPRTGEQTAVLNA